MLNPQSANFFLRNYLWVGELNEAFVWSLGTRDSHLFLRLEWTEGVWQSVLRAVENGEQSISDPALGRTAHS